MKQEIKERVERIRKGEVPEGYKETKVGIIPDDWSLNPLISISSMNGRIGWQGLKQSEFTINPDDPFLITGMNFKDGTIRWEEVYHIPHNRYNEAKQIQLKIDDVLMTKDGTIGKLLYVDQIPYPSKASLNSHLLVFRPLHNKYIPKFLFYQLDSNIFKHHIELEKSGSTFFGITQEGVGKYKFLYPHPPEQQKIADIISTWDKAIELKEKLIEEKKEFKRRLMQKLLTGKTRFPEFTDEWVETNLNKIVEKINNKNDEKNQTIVTISAKKGFINQSEYFNKIVASKDLSGYYLIKKGDFAYNKSYSNGYPVGVIKRLESFEKAVVTTLYICFRIKDNTISSDFLKYYFDSVLLNRQIKRIANEGGRAHGLLNVTPSDFFNIKIKIPDILEQEKIADVLLSQDKKIHLMELTLNQLKEQKRGLMQLLLTGIVRVEVD